MFFVPVEKNINAMVTNFVWRERSCQDASAQRKIEIVGPFKKIK